MFSQPKAVVLGNKPGYVDYWRGDLGEKFSLCLGTVWVAFAFAGGHGQIAGARILLGRPLGSATWGEGPENYPRLHIDRRIPAREKNRNVLIRAGWDCNWARLGGLSHTWGGYMGALYVPHGVIDESFLGLFGLVYAIWYIFAVWGYVQGQKPIFGSNFADYFKIIKRNM